MSAAATPSSSSPTTHVPPERYIVVPLYSRIGLCNTRISLELAVVLASWTGRTLVLDRSLAQRHATTGEYGSFTTSGPVHYSWLHILDLYDVPVPTYRPDDRPDCVRPDDDPGDTVARWLGRETQRAAHEVWTPTTWPSDWLDAAIILETDPALVDEDDVVKTFKYRVQKPRILWIQDLLDRPERIVRLRLPVQGKDPATYAFGFAPTIFYGARAETRRRLAQVLLDVRPKPVLWRLAESLRPTVPYSTIHLRRQDYRRYQAKHADLRGESLVPVLQGALAKHGDDANTHRWLVSTDDADDATIWEPIRQAFPGRVDLLTDAALDRAPWHLLEGDPRLRTLTRNPVVRAIVSLLACVGGRDFFGTPFSAYTSHIHQLRGYAGQTDVRYLYDPPPWAAGYSEADVDKDDGTYSWRRFDAGGVGFARVPREYWTWLTTTHDTLRKPTVTTTESTTVVARAPPLSAQCIFSTWIDGAVYINLKHRTDRRRHMEQHLERIGFPAERTHRLEATYMPLNGYKGGADSHARAIQWGRCQSWGRIWILEDDADWRLPTRDELEAKMARVATWLHQQDDAWDVLMTSATVIQSEPTTCPDLVRVTCAQSADSYIVNGRRPDVVRALYECFRACRDAAPDDIRGQMVTTLAMDQQWKRLQPKGRWYALSPVMSGQMPSYSDILNYGRTPPAPLSV